jgi:hypothetical protein
VEGTLPMKLFKSKKASGGFFLDNWPEIFFFVVLVIGFIISITLQSAVIIYTTILLSGIMAGRLIFEREQKMKFPYFLIIIGFLIGYLIGVQYGERKVMIVLFVIGGFMGYYFRKKKIYKDFRY